MYCPECGNDAGDAKFCPECGNDLGAVRQAQSGHKPGGRPAGRPAATPSGDQRPRAARRAAERRAQAAPTREGAITPKWIWLGFAAAAIVAVVIIFALGNWSDGGTAGTGAAGAGATGSATATITADTSGSYSQLVDRANRLYDQGITAFNNDDATQGEAYFRAAATVYEAAWGKKAGDPNVGTDWAVSLFYSRHHDEALERIEAVLKENPDFQPGLLNKGIFLRTEADEAEEQGESAKADDFLAQAKTTLQKAVDIDATTDTGQRAAQILEEL